MRTAFVAWSIYPTKGLYFLRILWVDARILTANQSIDSSVDLADLFDEANSSRYFEEIKGPLDVQKLIV
jgi:hypothetical protein